MLENKEASIDLLSGLDGISSPIADMLDSFRHWTSEHLLRFPNSDSNLCGNISILERDVPCWAISLLRELLFSVNTPQITLAIISSGFCGHGCLRLKFFACSLSSSCFPVSDVS